MTKFRKLSIFLMITGFSLAALGPIYSLVVSMLGLQFQNSFLWFYAEAGGIYVFIAFSLRFWLFKDELKSSNRPVSRTLMIGYIVFGIVAVGFVYGRLRFHSIPEGKRLLHTMEMRGKRS